MTGVVSIDYNLHWADAGAPNIRWLSTYPTWTQWKALGFDTHGVNADPLFVNAAGADFRLRLASPCIDAAVDVGLTEDYLGNAVPRP